MRATEEDRNAVRAMAPAQKLAVLNAMIVQAWDLKEAWIRVRRPELSPSEVRALARSMVGGPTP
jgi:uncharacterized protein YfkK (UPF0435 family)